MQTVNVRVPAREIKFEIRIGSGLISGIGEAARKALGPSTRRAALISNRKVFDLFGEKVLRALRSSGFDCSVWLMKDGEQHKSMRRLAARPASTPEPEKIWSALFISRVWC